jgi:hypothetical protein
MNKLISGYIWTCKRGDNNNYLHKPIWKFLLSDSGFAEDSSLQGCDAVVVVILPHQHHRILHCIKNSVGICRRDFII